mmetsp:Transcript_7130/g.44196  ORF Transcript_7130/g.44196 Transcript_7130/m.44196 type:complete len:107 (-) Transcript_7130:2260-2580(-)
MSRALRKAALKLPPEVNQILYVRNLPFDVTGEEMFDIFGKFGPVMQIRLGNAKETKGTAFVAYEDVLDAKSAKEHLSGFNVRNRYLIVLYHQPEKAAKKAARDERE